MSVSTYKYMCIFNTYLSSVFLYEVYTRTIGNACSSQLAAYFFEVSLQVFMYVDGTAKYRVTEFGYLLHRCRQGIWKPLFDICYKAPSFCLRIMCLTSSGDFWGFVFFFYFLGGLKFFVVYLFGVFWIFFFYLIQCFQLETEASYQVFAPQVEQSICTALWKPQKEFLKLHSIILTSVQDPTDITDSSIISPSNIIFLEPHKNAK